MVLLVVIVCVVLLLKRQTKLKKAQGNKHLSFRMCPVVNRLQIF